MNRRILFIDETACLGGAEINLLMLASRLRARGWHVSVVLPRRGPLSSKLAAAGIPVDYVPGAPQRSLSFYLGDRKLPDPLAWLADAWRCLIWTTRLRRHLLRVNVSLVQTVSLWAHVCGGIATRLAGLPVIAHFQDLVDPRSGFGLHRRLIRAWAASIPHRVFCISPKVAAQFEGLPGTEGKTDVILNTIDVGKFAPASKAVRAKRGASQDGLRIGTVARLTRWKGQHVALQAAHMLRSDVDFRWVFVGDASLGASRYAHRLQASVRQLGLHRHVEFVDWIDDMPTFYRSLDLLVHVPTEPEPFGLVLGEAMACGVPVVTTAGGGAEPLVRAGEGVIVPPHDAGAVAESILRLSNDRSERRMRAEKARRFAVQTFSVERYVDRWVNTYQALLEEVSP